MKHGRAIILCIFIFLGVFRLVGMGDRREEMLATFIVGVSLVLAIYLWQINRWWSMFLILACFSQFYPAPSPMTHDAFNNVVFGCLWFALIVNFFTPETVPDLLNAICIIALGNVVYLLMQYYGVDPVIKLKDPDNLVATLSNKNEASALLAYSFAAFMRSRWCWFIPFILLGFVLTKSFGGPLAVAAGISFYTAMQSGWFLLAIPVSIGALVLYLLFVDVPYMRRLEAFWIVLTEHYPKRPWFGIGIGRWKFIFKPVKFVFPNGREFVTRILPDKSSYYYYWAAHNVYLQMLVEMGVGFLVILSGFARDSILRYRKEAIISATAIIIIAVNSFYHYGWHSPTTAWLGATWLAIYQIQTNGKLVLQKDHDHHINIIGGSDRF